MTKYRSPPPLRYDPATDHVVAPNKYEYIRTFYRRDLRVCRQTGSDQIDRRHGDRTGRHLHAVTPHSCIAVGHRTTTILLLVNYDHYQHRVQMYFTTASSSVAAAVESERRVIVTLLPVVINVLHVTPNDNGSRDRRVRRVAAARSIVEETRVTVADVRRHRPSFARRTPVQNTTV